MELSRSYPGSAFTEYYPSSQTQYYSFPDYSRPSPYPGTFDVQTPRVSLGANTYTTKSLGNDTYPTATTWNTLPTAMTGWDPKPDGLLVRPLDITPVPSQPPKRKRKTTPQQRVAANIRERRRMCNLNTAFDRLRRRVPAFPHEKRLSRIQTLRLAITYISFMTELLSGQDIRTLLERQEQTKPVVWQPYELEDLPTNGQDLGAAPGPPPAFNIQGPI